ncbi:MAG: hypothetical protein ACRCVL_05355, partial [Cetobacterium sp.]
MKRPISKPGEKPIRYGNKYLYEESCESIASLIARPTASKPPGNIKIAHNLRFPHCYRGYGHKKLGEIKNCEEVWEANKNVRVATLGVDGKISKHIWTISDLVKKGTLPIADVFWYCGQGQSLRQRLPEQWGGICAPVILIGTLRVLPIGQIENPVPTLPLGPITNPVPTRLPRRRKRFSYDEDKSVYVDWAGIPVGIPDEYRAQGQSAVDNLLVFFPWLQLKKNAEWINYIWYNQQRFVNATILALQGIERQLHAVSVMALQNRLAIDTMRAPDDGVCSLIGDECCSVIPMHTGEGGNLTVALKALEDLRMEHV